MSKSLSLKGLVLSVMISLAGCSPSHGDAQEPAADAAPSVPATAADAGKGADATPNLAAPTTLVLPGPKYYPENLHAATDGTIFVGSLGTGAVVKFAPGATSPTTVLPGGDPQGVTGVLVDDASSTLWVGAVTDFASSPPKTELRSYGLDGTKKATYTFSRPAFVNDFAVRPNGDLFITDSFGAVWRLPKGAAAPIVWSTDPLLAPSSPSGFGADGIVYDAASNVLLVDTFSDGRLIRIPIQGDTAGQAVEITVTPKLQTPDGMRLLDAETVVAADGAAGAIVKITLTGDTAVSSTIASGFAGPTGVTRVGDALWVSEGQLGHLLGSLPGDPSLPFTIKRVALQ
jgi:sugar lactone lactonase YvrE